MNRMGIGALSSWMQLGVALVTLAVVGCGDSDGAGGAAAGGPSAGGATASGGAGGGVPATPDPQGFRVIADTMPAHLRYHAASLVPDGRVLITGGSVAIDGAPRKNAFVFDPASESFKAVGSMVTARANHSSTALANGKVLLAGGGRSNIIGLPSNLDVTDSAELFDPATGTFTAVGAMTSPRSGHQAVTLADGRVLLVGGGLDQEGVACNAAYPDCFIAKTSNTAEIYDPESNAFEATGSMADARIAFTLTPLADGRVLALAGADDADTLPTSEIFDPATGTWSPGPALARDRLYHATVRLGDGRLIMVTGKDGNVSPLSDSALLDADITAWTAGPAYGETLTAVAGLPLPSGNALFLGGYNQIKQAETVKVRIFDQATSTFTEPGDLNAPRGLATATLLADGRVLVCGGFSNGGSSNTCEISQ